MGQSPLPDGISTAELAAWTNVYVILNLHETILELIAMKPNFADESMRVTRHGSFLSRTAMGVGGVAAQGSLLNPGAPGRFDPGWCRPLAPCSEGQAGHLDDGMAGGPSHLETLDYKPALASCDGELMPVADQGAAARPAAGSQAGLLRTADQVQEVRPLRARALATCFRTRRLSPMRSAQSAR